MEQNVEQTIQKVVTVAVQEVWRKVPTPKQKPKGNVKQYGEGKTQRTKNRL